MKIIYTFLFLIFLSQATNAQKMKGIWRGYFEQVNFNMSQGGFIKDRYKYEVQINQLVNNALEGVTYSFHNTDFYAKVTCNGIYQSKRKTIVLKELKVIEVRKMPNTNACAMTCYLDYAKEGDLETLTGTYTSINMDNKEDCGSGTVYLERVTTTKFKKEPFLLNTVKEKNNITPPTASKNIDTKKALSAKDNTVAKQQSNILKKADPITKITPLLPKTKTPKPGAEGFVIKKDTLKKIAPILSPKEQPTVNQLPKNLEDKPKKTESKEVIPIPKILIDRANKVNATLEVDAKEVTLEFYDNGEIDGDYISIYKDNKKLVDNKVLSLNPITLHLTFDDVNNVQEIIAVAESLGKVPPNTAFLVVTFGNKREEVLLTSDNSRNATIVITYKNAKRVK